MCAALIQQREQHERRTEHQHVGEYQRCGRPQAAIDWLERAEQTFEQVNDRLGPLAAQAERRVATASVTHIVSTLSPPQVETGTGIDLGH